MDYTDAGDVDSLALMGAMRADGGYNVGLSSNLGSVRNTAKICRPLGGARERGIRLVVQALAWNADFSPNLAAMEERLLRFKDTLAHECPENAGALYAWYGYEEPMNKVVSLSEMRQAYQRHKKHFSSTGVLTVFTQNQNYGDSDDNGMLGEPLNRYTPDVADIVGLDFYPALPEYGYLAIGILYRYVSKVVDATKPVWAVSQAHALVGDLGNCESQPRFRPLVLSKFRSRLIEAGGEGFSLPPYVCNRALRVNFRRKTSDRPIPRRLF